MNEEGQKEANSAKVKRPTIRAKQVEARPKEEEKNLSIYCRPSKVVNVNEFLKTYVIKDKQTKRENYVRKSGFGFLLDLAVEDPSKNDVMALVRKRWNGEDIMVTADHVQEMYGAVRFGQMRIDMDATWSDKAKREFKHQLGHMGIPVSEHLYLNIKQLELALKRNEKAVLNNKQWAEIYVLYALSIFLLGSTTNVIWGKYWQYIVPLAEAQNYDWMEHIAARANAEFVRASEALKCGTYIKIGGNCHALLNNSVNISRSPKTRNVPSVAAKLPVRRTKTSDQYHNMSLYQLYENFHKLHIEREDVDKKIDKLHSVREAVDKKIEIVKIRIAEKKMTVEENSGGDPDDVKDQDNEEDGKEDNENDNEAEVEEGTHADEQRPDVRPESKRKVPSSIGDDEVEATNKKGRTMTKELEMCTPWDTQFIMEVDRFVDEVVRSTSKSKLGETECDSTAKIAEELPCPRPARTTRAGPHTRTPFMAEPQKKYSKKKKDKKVIEDPDFEISDQRPFGFVSVPPKDNQRDYQITTENCEAARTCYESMTLEQKQIVVRYAMDTKIGKDLPGELLVFDKSSYLLREDAISLRRRQWVSSIVPEFYARAKARQVHNSKLPVDRIVFSGQTGMETRGHKRIQIFG